MRGIAEARPDFAGAADEEGFRRIGLPLLSVLAFAVGIVTGLGAVLFRDLIGFVHNLLFLGQLSFRYDANHFTPPSPWGPFVILVPVIGAVAVTFLVTKFAPEARGHGVPEVMDAIYYKGGVIRPVVAVVKSLASAISIGSGAAVGGKARSSKSARRWARPWGKSSESLRGSALPWSRRVPAPASRRPSICRSAGSCLRSS